MRAIRRAYCIHTARVFATGFSNGAFFSHVLACAMSDRFAAVVEYCEEDYDHHWPPQATARVWEFFQAHPMTP